MKNDFLKLALEEAGLVETENTPELEELVEQQVAEDEEVAEKAEELEKVEEVQEGLEALVASMESALADPYYSPREYQLQVSHAATLLKRIGLGLPAGLSCESTDGAEAAKEGFADKAKKLGKVAADYAKKFLAWLKDVMRAALARCRALYGKIAAKQKTPGFKEAIPAGAEYEVEGAWDGFEFDPKDPARLTSEAGKYLLTYSSLFSVYLHELSRDDNKDETYDRYLDSFKKIFNTSEAKNDFGILVDGSYQNFIRPEAVTYKGKVSANLVDTARAEKSIASVNNQLAAFEKVVAGVKDNTDVSKVLRDATKVCNWVRDVVTLEAKAAAAYVQAASKRAEEPAK